jgi:hypothetical protein
LAPPELFVITIEISAEAMAMFERISDLGHGGETPTEREGTAMSAADICRRSKCQDSQQLNRRQRNGAQKNGGLMINYK